MSSETVKPEKIILDHKPKISYLNCCNNNDNEIQTYTAIIRKLRTEPSTRVIEGHDKKAGKLIYFKRNVFVPPRDVINVRLSEANFKSGYVWEGIIAHESHNLPKQRAGKVETWSEFIFLNKVQTACQYPDITQKEEKLSFFITETVEGNLNFELKTPAIKGFGFINYIRPCILNKLEIKPKVLLSLSPIVVFKNTLIEMQKEQFIRFCKSGRLDLAKNLFGSLGLIDVNTFEYGANDQEEGWNSLQHACYNGRIRIVRWLISDLKANVLITSHDGWTPLHCACKNGHYEIAQFLLDNGADLNAPIASNGETAISLLVAGGFVGMLRKFVSDDSALANTYNVQFNGVRDKTMDGMMFNVMKHAYKF